MRKPRSKRKTVGYGFVARWDDGTLGWALPSHLGGHPRKYPDRLSREDKPWLGDEPAYLCKITVQLVKDKRGRPIVRRK